MPMKNGKIVGLKPKKKTAEPENIIDKQKAKATKKLRDKALGKKKSVEVDSNASKKDVKKKKPKKVSEDFIRTGANGAIKIEESDFNGKSVVAIRKMFCTQADPEMKMGKGGFNLPADAEILDSVIAALQEIRDNL